MGQKEKQYMAKTQAGRESMIQREVERVQEQDHAGPAGPLKSLVFIHREQMYGYQGGGGWEELGDWD